jgi:hypothetical protein
LANYGALPAMGKHLVYGPPIASPRPAGADVEQKTAYAVLMPQIRTLAFWWLSHNRILSEIPDSPHLTLASAPAFIVLRVRAFVAPRLGPIFLRKKEALRQVVRVHHAQIAS